MNRQVRRQQERELQKSMETIQKLTPAQTKIVNLVSREKAKIIADEYIAKFTEIIEMSFTAAMLECGLSWGLAEKIMAYTNELTIEDMEKMNNLKKEGNVEMATKKMELEVRKEIERLLELGETKQDIINKLVFGFPKLSKSMLVNAYAKIIAEKESSDLDVTEAMEEIADILGEDEKEVKKVLKQVEEIKVDETVEILAENIEEKTVIKEAVAAPSGLKIKALNIELEGANGNYTITDSGMKLKSGDCELYFESKDQFYEFAKEIGEVFNLQEEYKNKIS